MHWADVLAEQLLEGGPSEHVVASGITPSGSIHVGNMREVLTADAVVRAIRDLDGKARLLFIGDTFDPLRKVYPFLDESYAEHVGKPLSRIPCPCGEHESYAQHFLAPFLETLATLGIHPEVVLSHELYASGRYLEAVERTLAQREQVREVLERVSQRELPADWVPYSPLCTECGRIAGVTATGVDGLAVSYRCLCGHEGTAAADKGEGKLPWRLDWPARWWFLGVTMEPFGKDHATAGGSYETGAELVRLLYEREPPEPQVYEWIHLKGRGAMHSSSGLSIAAEEMVRIAPPETLRWLIMRSQPSRHIDFDPGFGLLHLVDDYDSIEQQFFAGEGDEDRCRAYELSQPHQLPGEPPVPIPYRHLVTLAQAKPDFAAIVETLARTEHFSQLSEVQERRLKRRVECVRLWLERHAPGKVRFTVQEAPPEMFLSLPQRRALERLARELAHIDWEPQPLHDIFYDVEEATGIPAKVLFKLVYSALLGQRRGPRMGFFLSTLDRVFVVRRLKHY